LNAQITHEQQTELEALNKYIQFTNESTHGLLIVHRLIEGFNQTVNKYVDLESTQLNFYNNSDLPKDIFKDPEHWFYDTTPIEWYQQISNIKQGLPPKITAQLKVDLEQLKSIINRVNAIRFELDDLTKQDDLKKRKNLTTIYKKLEECVVLYDDFNFKKQRLKKNIQKRYIALQIKNEHKALGNAIAIHENIRAFLEGVRNDDAKNLKELVQHLKNNLETANGFNINDRNYQQVLKKATAFQQVAEKYLSGTGFPSEYKLYGRIYYYYNVEMVAKFNRYGSGLVTDLNKWILKNQFPVLLQLEEPHFFKVVYPKKEISKPETLAAEPVQAPKVLRERDVIIRQKQIYVSPGTITIEVYDHQEQDGDIISLNYNGHWVLENYPIRRKSKKLNLPLKANDDNYLVLHAVNLGSKPPNTATLSYIYKGEKKSIVMESDMNESEMIKIHIKD
jgi:hypothetical protein